MLRIGKKLLLNLNKGWQKEGEYGIIRLCAKWMPERQALKDRGAGTEWIP